MRWLRRLSLVGGILLLAYAVVALDVASVARMLLRVRWWFPIALASTFIVQLLRTLAWSLVLTSYGRRIAFASLYRIRLVGEALNYLSMAGPFLGDPAKAWLISSETGIKETVTSVAFDRYLSSLSAVLFLAAVASFWLPSPGVAVVLLIGTVIAVSPAFVSRYSRRLSLPRMYAVMGIHLVSHLFLALEVGILLSALGAGVTVWQAFSIEAVTKGVNAVFFFVPLQVGVFEGSHVAMLHYLKMGATLGLTLGLARRLRSLFWSALGLIMLWTSRRHRYSGGHLVRCCYSSEPLTK